jgi:hypothetical protein
MKATDFSGKPMRLSAGLKMSWTTDLEKRLGCLMPKGERDIQQERIW